ncbi:MAG: hypothetical protein JSU86_08230 [Phycisphaerales bacterium]|nr:MAG: hypothetical protein JSU86_08230 [Phycisphaerales bacterium]
MFTDYQDRSLTLVQQQRVLDLHQVIVETLGTIDRLTQSDVRRLLQELRTGDDKVDRQVEDDAGVLYVLALLRPRPLGERDPIRFTPSSWN